MAYDVAALRARIPALSSGTAFFDGPGGSQTPGEVGDAIAAALAAPLSNRGALTAAARHADRIVTEARAAMADLLGAQPGGIVFGRSMTQLTYDLARTLSRDWGAGDEVVVTRLDHDANIRPWVQAASRAGVTVRWVDFDPVTGELTPEHVAAVLSPRTRLVAVTGASNLIGTMPDVAAIAQLAHARGALVVCDAVHLAAHMPVDLGSGPASPDVVLCSPYKFLGPHLGVLAAAPQWLASVHPDKLVPSSDTVPERFELGTLPYESLAGTTAAVDVLASLGDPGGADRRARLRSAYLAIATHEDALRATLERGLAALPAVIAHGEAAHRTPTLLLTFADRDAHEVADALAVREINAPAGSFYALEASRHLGLGDVGGLRIGIAPYTDREDVARLVDALTDVTSATNLR